MFFLVNETKKIYKINNIVFNNYQILCVSNPPAVAGLSRNFYKQQPTQLG